MRLCNKIATYIKTGYLLHFITLGELVMIYIMLHTLRLGHWMMEENTTTRFFILLPFLWSPIFPQLDARSRYQDYKMMKDYFYIYGFDARLVKRIAKSRCQRDAVIIAAGEMGVEKECRNYFNTCGYRWYHLFPDVIFEKPVVLLCWQFWQTTFFTKTYHPKVDYSSAVQRSVKDISLQQHKAA
ncbi:MAG TPA: hypothetical protein VG738_02390 [Chitinophagaceae bacterium]|nr:hypothetical protein [Chitinophagaceae bacterium]